MVFSCPSKTSLTESELLETYSNGKTQSMLPSSPNGPSDREQNGMLTENTIQGIILSLQNSAVIPNPSNNELYKKKKQELLDNIKSEYCFYDSRYKYALDKLFSLINQSYNNKTSESSSSVQQYLSYTQSLNQRLNDLTQIVNGITDLMLSTTNTLESEMKDIDRQLKEQKDKLAEQNRILSSNQAVTQLNKQMVKFTEQKGKYSNNLLGLYSFLNIVALGLLVYVYKSARD